MNFTTPQSKALRKLDHELVTLVIGQAFIGVALVGYSVREYLKGNFNGPLETALVPIATHQSLLEITRLLIFLLIPAIAFSHLFAAYCLWRHFKKRKNLQIQGNDVV